MGTVRNGAAREDRGLWMHRSCPRCIGSGALRRRSFRSPGDRPRASTRPRGLVKPPCRSSAGWPPAAKAKGCPDAGGSVPDKTRCVKSPVLDALDSATRAHPPPPHRPPRVPPHRKPCDRSGSSRRVEPCHLPLNPGDEEAQAAVGPRQRRRTDPPDQQVLTAGEQQVGRAHDCHPTPKTKPREQGTRDRIGLRLNAYVTPGRPDVEGLGRQEGHQREPVAPDHQGVR